MKFSIAAALLLLPSPVPAMQPARVAYDSMGSCEMLQTSFGTTGMISITGVPGLNKMKTLESLPDCLSAVGKKYEFPDGTLRKTIAAFSSEPLDFAEEPSCQAFEKESKIFREVVQQVSKSFVHHLASELGLEHEVLLTNSTDKTNHGLTFENILDQGTHLEHFHGYYKETASSSDETIDMHVDQGMMLIFTPGMVNGQTTDGFYVQLPNGSTEMVDFGPQDDLVVFFGDATEDIVNTYLVSRGKTPLRIMPHALNMPTSSSPRVWYGTMMLPPPNALHPSKESQTYGDIRQNMIHGDLSIGCSSPSLQARVLAEDTCDNETSAYCWHNCMNYTDFDVDPDVCASRQLDLACVNADGLLWPGNIHDNQFGLGCADLETAEVYSNATAGGDHNASDHTNSGAFSALSLFGAVISVAAASLV